VPGHVSDIRVRAPQESAHAGRLETDVVRADMAFVDDELEQVLQERFSRVSVLGEDPDWRALQAEQAWAQDAEGLGVDSAAGLQDRDAVDGRGHEG